jgi:hypothetical protein
LSKIDTLNKKTSFSADSSINGSCEISKKKINNNVLNNVTYVLLQHPSDQLHKQHEYKTTMSKDQENRKA